MSDEKMLCDNCEKDCEELVTREGFQVTYFVHWVCPKCFEELEGETFENFGRKDEHVG